MQSIRRLAPFLLIGVALLWAALPATDSFAGTNGTALATYSASWTINAGGFTITTTDCSAPHCAAGTISATNMASWNADTFAANQYAQVALPYPTASSQGGPAVRMAVSGDTGYRCICDSGTCVMQLHNAGAETGLGTDWTGTVAAGAVVRLEVSGSALTCKLNGTTIITATDTTLTTGRAGIGAWSAAYLDAWEGGNLSAGSRSIRRGETF